MELISFSMINIVLCVVGVIVMIYGWKFFNWIWLKPKKMEKFLRQQGLNGNPYKFLYGDAKKMIQVITRANLKPINLTNDIVPRAMPFIHNSIKTHGKGKVFFTWLGPQPVVHVTEGALIQEALTNYSQFQKPIARNPLTKLLVSGVATAEGDRWIKHRKILKPAFHVENLKHMLPAFHISCSEMINKWEELTKEGSCEVDVYPHLQTFTSDVISRTAFGSSYEEGRKIFEHQTEQASLVIDAMQSMYISGSRFLPTKYNRRMKENDRVVKAAIKNIINKRETTMKAMKIGESSNDDLLSILLDSNDKEIKQHGNKSGLNVDEVIQECKLFYFVGQETTSSLLVWTMILLGQHTNWQDRARDEVLKVFGQAKPDIDGLSHLKVITMIMHEVLRLYTPGVSLRRMNHEESTLGNITLPAGSSLELHLLLLHHDIDIWGNDVMEFKPERFVEGVSKATKGHMSYLPFSGGPRICIGQNFAMLEAKLALVMILSNFSFELSPSYAHAPHSIFSLQPQFGAQLILRKL